MVSGGWGLWPYVWNVFIKNFFLHVLLIVKFSLSFKKGRRFSIRFLALLPPLSKVSPSTMRNLILKDKEETRNFSESFMPSFYFQSASASHYLLCSCLVRGHPSLFQELSKFVQFLLVWFTNFIYLLLSLTALLSWLLFPFWEVLRNKRTIISSSCLIEDKWRWWWLVVVVINITGSLLRFWKQFIFSI